jgi:integrase
MPDETDGFGDWLRRRGRERSATKYCQIIRRWIENPVAFERKISASGHAPSYRRNLVAAVRAWAKYQEDHELASRFDDVRLPPPVPQDQREPFLRDDWFTILDTIEGLDDPRRSVCALIALRGIRCGDVLRLERRDIARAIDSGTLSFESKGQRWQHFSATPLLASLRRLDEMEWRGGRRVRNLVCPRSLDEDAQESAGRAIRRAFDGLADELGMKREDLYAHRFRHTYATLYLQEMQGDPEAVFKLQSQMGWARLETAASYLRRSRRDELDEVESKMLQGRNNDG